MAKEYPTGSWRFIVSNDASANLSAGISDTSLAIVLDNGGTPPSGIVYAYTNFPDPTTANEELFTVSIEDEIILCHSRAGDTVTVYSEATHGYNVLDFDGNAIVNGRGWADTTASTHVADLNVSHNVEKSTTWETQEAIIKNTADIATLDTVKIERDGSVAFAGDQSMASHKITNLAAPAALSNDAVRKVDLEALSTSDFSGDGSDGSLNISSGTTNIALDTIKEYTSVSITGTAILSTSDVTGHFMLIKSQGNVLIASGAVSAIDLADKFVRPTTQEIITIVNNGTLESRTPSVGGAGGAGGAAQSIPGGVGGATTTFYGGGGGGGSADHASAIGGAGGVGGTPAGTGGAGASPGAGAAGAGAAGGLSSGGGGGAKDDGVGALEVGGDGGDAYGTAGANGTADNDGASGGGGGGGSDSGKCGITLLFNVNGNFNYNGATINSSGGNSGAGGDGGDKEEVGIRDAGGGGGGGSGGGGSAGDIIVNYTGTLTEGTTSAIAGTAGAGGTGGTGTTYNGVNGTAGTVGTAGKVHISKYLSDY